MKDNILLNKYAAQLLLLIVSLTFFSVTQAKVIMVFGDSLSAAYGMDINDGWVKLLETRLNDKNKSQQLLATLVRNDIPVYQFGPEKTNMQDAYLETVADHTQRNDV